MNILLAAGLALSVAATDLPEPRTSDNAPAARAEVTAVAPAQAPAIAPVLTRVEAPESAPAAATVQAQQRGSFLWTVGAIVVAGLVLAIILR